MEILLTTFKGWIVTRLYLTKITRISKSPIAPVGIGLNAFICDISGFGYSVGSSLITGNFNLFLSVEIVVRFAIVSAD